MEVSTNIRLVLVSGPTFASSYGTKCHISIRPCKRASALLADSPSSQSTSETSPYNNMYIHSRLVEDFCRLSVAYILGRS